MAAVGCEGRRTVVSNAVNAYINVVPDPTSLTTPTIRDVETCVKERQRDHSALAWSFGEDGGAALTDTLEQEDEGTGLDLATSIRRRFAPFGDVVLDPHPDAFVDLPPILEF